MSSYIESLVAEFERLAIDESDESIATLKKHLEVREGFPEEKHVIPRLACQALLMKGIRGVAALKSVLPSAPGYNFPLIILASLWHAGEGRHGPMLFATLDQKFVLSREVPAEARELAKEAFFQFVEDAKTDPESFDRLINLLHHEQMHSSFDRASNERFHQELFRVIADSTITITGRTIRRFQALLTSSAREEEYQTFLTDNPVFLNPLASRLIPKHKLGDDLITDYVLETLTGEYIAVEIEKPSDPVFTQANDFSHQFTHGFGQVIDFI